MTKPKETLEAITVMIYPSQRAKMEQAAVKEGVIRKNRGGLSAIVREALELYFLSRK